MIQNPERPDRLSALVAAMAPRAHPMPPDDPAAPALLVTGDAEGPGAVILRLRAGCDARVLCAARLSLRIPLTTVFHNAPDRVTLALADRPALAGLAQVLVAESQALRCGWAPTLSHLAEAMLIIALRGAIDSYPAGGPPGLLAGLAHPRLHRALAAMHDRPAEPWTIDALARLSGMSRSSFMQAFAETLGTSPAAYLAHWRLTGARAALRSGASLRQAAQDAGFTSAEGFSRAFRRFHGLPPSHVRAEAKDASG